MTASATIEAIAGHDLRTTPIEIVDRPLSDTDFDAVVREAGDHGLLGLLHAAIAAGSFPATDAQRDLVRARVEFATAWVLGLEAELLRVCDAFERRGIDHRVLKGPVAARMVDADPGWRLYTDIDLLVRPMQIERAGQTLVELAARRRGPLLAPGFDRLAKGVTWVTAKDQELDLHCRLVWGPLGWLIDDAQLFERPLEIEVAGTRLRALSPELQLVHLGHELTVTPRPRLRHAVDVRHVLDVVEPDDVLAVCRASGVRAVLAHGLVVAADLVDIDEHPLVDWARGFRPSRRDRSLLALHGPSAGWRRQAVAAVPFVRPRRALPTYARGLIAAARGGGERRPDLT